jgi:SAM-dependent methyltransferase
MIDVSERTGDLPDLGPDTYRRWRASEIGTITERLERQLILEMLGNVHGLRVLDVGCGDGELACELAAHGAIVTGVDSSGAMIEAAKYQSTQQVSDIAFQVSRAENLPFRDEHFDIVTAVTILCFVRAVALSSANSASGAHGRPHAAFGHGWARPSGAMAGFEQPASCGGSLRAPASVSKKSAAPSSIHAFASRPGYARLMTLW